MHTMDGNWGLGLARRGCDERGGDHCCVCEPLLKSYDNIYLHLPFHSSPEFNIVNRYLHFSIW
jgi:hypothetical protein